MTKRRPARESRPKTGSGAAGRPALVAVLILATVCIIALSPAIFTARVPAQTDWLLNYGPWGTMPWTPHSSPVFNQGNGDDFFVYVPDRIAAVNEWKSGRVPLWNPYVSGGVSFLGMQTSNPLDPLIVLELLLPTGVAMGLEYALLFFLAGLGVVLLLRDQGVRDTGALALGGITFALSPYFVTWMENRVFLAGLATLPLAVWAMERIVTRRRAVKECGLLALAVGYASLGGTLQTFAIIVLLLLIRLAWLVATSRKSGDGEEGEGRPSAGGLGLAGAALLAGAAVGIIPLVAGFEMLHASTRLGSLGYYAGRNFLHWRSVALWFNLDVFSLPDAEFAAFQDLGRRFMTGSGWGALGIVPTLLAALALLRRSGPARERIFWGAIGGLTLVFLLLQATPLHAALVGAFPWLDDVDLLRGLVVVNLAGSILAAWGAVELDSLWSNRENRTKWLVPALVFVLVGITAIVAGRAGLQPAMSLVVALLPVIGFTAAVAIIGFLPLGRNRAGTRALLLAVLVAGELSWLHFKVNTFSSADLTFPPDPLTAGMQKFLGDPDHPRYVTRSPLRLFPPNTGSVYGLSDIRGYSNIPTARYRLLLECAEGKTDLRNNPGLSNFTSPVYDLLGAKVLLAHSRPDSSYVPLWNWGVFVRPKHCSRAFLVHRSVVVGSEAEMRRRLSAPDFDPLEAVLLEKESPLGSVVSSMPAENVRIDSLTPDRVRIHVETTAPGILVLADPFFPGWKATVDRAPAPIFPAYWGLRGVAVGAGTHDVVFTYRPGWLLPGAVLTALGLGFAVLFLAGRPGRSPGGSRT